MHVIFGELRKDASQWMKKHIYGTMFQLALEYVVFKGVETYFVCVVGF